MNMRRNECRESQRSVTAILFSLVLVTLVVVAAAILVPAAQAKDNSEENTRVYQHSYDEVFQASLQTIERMGVFVNAKDKDKGTISGSCLYQPPPAGGQYKVTYDILIEALNTKPETQVRINVKAKSMFAGTVEKGFKMRFFTELQKVLSTYH